MPAVVLGLLGGHVVFIMTAITLATGDRSFAVVPEYYQKAVDYDQRKAALQESRALGWLVALQPDETIDAVGQRGVKVRITDRQGNPLSNLTLKIDCYHLSRASDALSLELSEIAPGEYEGQARMAKEGFWSFELTAVGEDTTFVTEFKQFIAHAEVAR